MGRLPHEYTGARSRAEAERDLLAVAEATGGQQAAHVTVDPDGGPEVRRTGSLSTRPLDGGRIELLVGDEPIVEFDPARVRGAWLSTYDGADFYLLRIDLGWGRVELSDA